MFASCGPFPRFDDTGSGSAPFAAVMVVVVVVTVVAVARY